MSCIKFPSLFSGTFQASPSLDFKELYETLDKGKKDRNVLLQEICSKISQEKNITLTSSKEEVSEFFNPHILDLGTKFESQKYYLLSFIVEILQKEKKEVSSELILKLKKTKKDYEKALEEKGRATEAAVKRQFTTSAEASSRPGSPSLLDPSESKPRCFSLYSLSQWVKSIVSWFFSWCGLKTDEIAKPTEEAMKPADTKSGSKPAAERPQVSAPAATLTPDGRALIQRILTQDPKGLINEGNTCFMASVMQAFILHDPEILDHVFKNPIIFPELHSFIFGIYASSGETVAGIDAVRAGLLKERFSRYPSERWSQQDAHEPLMAFYTKIISPSSLCIELKTYNQYKIEEGGPHPISSEASEMRERSDGQKYVERQGAVSVGVPYIEVEFPEKPPETAPLTWKGLLGTADKKGQPELEDLFKDFFVNENVSKGKNSYLTLLTGDSARGAYKEHDFFLIGERRRFETAPQTLPIILKRFKHEEGRESQKINTPVSIPFSFSLSEAYVEDQRARNYDFESFVFHEGRSPRGGHYFSYVRKGKRWFLANDGRISEVNPQNTDFQRHLAGAYMVKYRKQDS